MSNTYAKIEKVIKTTSFQDFPSYTNEMTLTLTAFVGGENKVQLTVTTQSTISNECGCGFIHLNNSDIDNLIAALLERKTGKITATGDEQSIFIPNI